MPNQKDMCGLTMPTVPACDESRSAEKMSRFSEGRTEESLSDRWWPIESVHYFENTMVCKSVRQYLIQTHKPRDFVIALTIPLIIDVNMAGALGSTMVSKQVKLKASMRMLSEICSTA